MTARDASARRLNRHSRALMHGQRHGPLVPEAFNWIAELRSAQARLCGGTDPRLDPFQRGGELLRGHSGVIGRLRPKPIAVRPAEKAAKPEIGIGRDRTPARHNPTDALGEYTDFPGHTALREFHWNQKFL